MSEVYPNPEAEDLQPPQAEAKLNAIGLVDGQFQVPRTDGTIDKNGWRYVPNYSHSQEGNGTVEVSAVVRPIYDKNGEKIDEIFKIVGPEEVLSWQPQAGNPSGDTVPGEALVAQPTSEAGAVPALEQIGKVAMGAAGVETEAGQKPVEPEAKLEAPEDATEPVEEQQSPQSEAREIFSSPEKFEQVMSDPNTDQGLKSQLNRLQQTWMEVQLAAVGDEVWDEMIKGRLQAVTDVLPSLEQSSMQVEQVAKEMQQGLMLLRDAMGNRDTQMVGEVIQRYRFGDKLGDLMNGLNRMNGDGQLGEVRRLLDADSIEADERVQRLQRGKNGRISENDLDTMIGDMQSMVDEGLDVSAMTAELSTRIKTNSPNWRGRKEAVETVTQFARMTESALDMQTKRFANEYEAFFDEVRRGRQDTAQADQITRVFLEVIMQQVEQARRLTRITAMAAQEAR